MFRSLKRAFLDEGDLSERQGAAVVAGAGVVFSVSAIAFRGVDTATDMQFLAYRGASTVLAMCLLIAARRRRHPVKFSGVTPRTWLAGLMLAAASMLFVFALARTSAATTLFMLAAAPVVAATLGWVLLKERVERSTQLAIGVTALGIVVMVGAGLDGGSISGLAFAALIPLVSGFYTVLQRSAADVDPIIPTLIAGSILTVGAGAFAAVQSGLAISGRDMLMATIAGGLALGVGLPLFNLGHRFVSAARIPMLSMTEVVLAPLWVWIWPGETPRATTLLGGAIVLAAVLLLMVGSTRGQIGKGRIEQGRIETADQSAVATGRSGSVDHPDHEPT